MVAAAAPFVDCRRRVAGCSIRSILSLVFQTLVHSGSSESKKRYTLSLSSPVLFLSLYVCVCVSPYFFDE